MGGKNHQPCNKYLSISTQMSRFASLAFAHLELANVGLEDLLLAEIVGESGNIDIFENELSNSQKNISYLIATIEKLRNEMKNNDFRDLLSIRPINLDAIGIMLINAKMVNSNAWDEVVKNDRSGGFYKNLEMINKNALSLVTHTDKLLEKIEELRLYAKNKSITEILEKNLDGNLKPEFAKLYFAWSQFQELFIASSLLSTEVYYAFNGYGSLINVAAQTLVA